MNNGDNISRNNANWSFSKETALNFDSHASKSIPFYEEGHNLISNCSDFFLSNSSICYDIGCSTGSLITKLSQHNSEKQIEFFGIEVEPDMANIANSRTKEFSNITILCEDIMDVELRKCDMIISYYTMQFIKPKIRQIVFDKIYESLNWGGAFLLFEKVRGADARFQDIMSALYVDYKLSKGYTEEQIINKARSLKGVLEPFSSQGNIDLLQRAGFADILPILKYVCFEGLLAIK